MILRLAPCPFGFPHRLLLPRAGTTNTSPEYEYEPLDGRQIRVIRLLPGRNWTRLEAEIETIEVQDGESRDFEALSYVWGSDVKTDALYIKGQPKPITASLSSLLRRLRHPAQTRRLWADAVCINQADLEEKGRQIALMATIYSVAARVLVDLGEETADSALAMALLDRFWRRHIWSGVPIDFNGSVLSAEDTARYIGLELPAHNRKKNELAVPDDTPKYYSWQQKQGVTDRLWAFYCRLGLLAELYGGFSLPFVRHGLGRRELPPPHDARWRSVGNLFARPWFSRIWIIQEFVLAREAVLLCGTRPYRWQHVVAGLYPFGGENPLFHSTALSGSNVGVMAFYCICVLRQHRLLRRTEWGRAFSARVGETGHLWRKFRRLRLIDLLHYFRISSATVDKDRYFALLSVADDVQGEEEDGKPRLELSYTAPADKILLRVGQFLIGNAYGEEMLGRAGIWQQGDAATPSWIQDFGSAQEMHKVVDQTVVYTGDQAGGPAGFHVSTLPVDEDSAAAGFIMVQGWKLDVVDTDPFISPFPATAPADGGDPSNMILDYIPVAIRALVGDGDGCEVRYFSGERVTAALCATLITGTRLSSQDHSKLEAGFHILSWVSVARENPRAAAWALHRAVTRFGVSRDEAWQLYWEYRKHVLFSVLAQQRQPARTRKGYFASLPSCFEKGDEIWVVKGCRTPLLLRRSVRFPGCYRLVRSCYVHGFMNGEALEKEGFRFEQLSLH